MSYVTNEACGPQASQAELAPNLGGEHADTNPSANDAWANPQDRTEVNWPATKSREALAKTPPKDIQRAEELLRDPNLIDRVIDDAHQLGLAGEEELIPAVYVVGVSRLLPRPLAALVTSASSTGKSFTINTVAKLFPPEVVVEAHRMTPKALETMEQGSLKNGLIVAGERSRIQGAAAAESTRALRELISDGRLVVCRSVKADGEWVTARIVQQGPVAFIESTTLSPAQIIDEDWNRRLILNADESSQQTARIIEAYARQVANPPDQGVLDGIIAVHHTSQRLLKQLPVVIPFSSEIGHHFPTERIEARRAIAHCLSLIQTVALLHQYQREQDAHGRLIASEDDYDIVRALFLKPLGRTLKRSLTHGALQLLEFLRQDTGEFTVRDMVAITQLATNTVGGRLRELLDAGQVLVTAQGAGRRPCRYILSPTPPPLHGLMLPPLSYEAPGLGQDVPEPQEAATGPACV